MKPETTRYFMSTDNDAHRYYIPWDRRAEWFAWCDIPMDDERAWETPDFAIRIDGGPLTFENPRIERDG